MKVIVVGAGCTGQSHAHAWRTIAGAEIAGIVTRGETGKALAKTLHCEWTPDLARMIDRTDVVDICVPRAGRAQYALAAAQAGKHIVCEAPLAGALPEARTILEESKKRQVHLLVGHSARLSAAYAKARQLVHGGEIGRPGVCRLVRAEPHSARADGACGDGAGSGDSLLDWGILDADWARWVFGDVERVYAATAGWSVGNERKSYAVATLRHQSGCITHVEVSRGHPTARYAIDVCGREGRIEFDSGLDGRPLTVEGAGGDVRLEWPAEKTPCQREIEHFAACLAGHVSPMATPEDAYEALRIVLAAKESVAAGAPITLAGAPS